MLFTTADVDLAVNPNEVSDTKWVSKDELEALFADSTLTFTPWFKLIAASFLYKWCVLEVAYADLAGGMRCSLAQRHARSSRAPPRKPRRIRTARIRSRRMSACCTTS